MSARPDWLTDDGLSAMRSARWSSDQAQVKWTPEFQKVWRMTKTDPWFDYGEGDGEYRGWLTKTGLKALAAIELEEMEANPLLRNFVRESNSSAPDAGWTKDAKRLHNYLKAKGIVAHEIQNEHLVSDTIQTISLMNDMIKALDDELVKSKKTLETLTGGIAVLMDRRCDGKMSDREFLSFLRTAIEPDVATEGLGGQ